MIEFFGEYSDKCQNEIFKRNGNNMFILTISTATMFTVILFIGWLFDAVEFKAVYGVTGIFCAIALFIKLSNIGLSKHPIRFKPTSKIVLENERIYFTQYRHKSKGLDELIEITMTKPFSKVKKVIDAGEWYYIMFSKVDISNFWICEKSLLKTGTLEEFEKMFEEKLKRKNSTK